MLEFKKSRIQRGGARGVVLILVLVLGDPDASARVTEQNNCEAIGSFRCRKRRRIKGEVEGEGEHEHDPPSPSEVFALS
jgi:hypothetical protein